MPMQLEWLHNLKAGSQKVINYKNNTKYNEKWKAMQSKRITPLTCILVRVVN